MRTITRALLLVGATFAAASTQAAIIELDLGASAQDFTETGIGPNTVSGVTYANWTLTQGACTGSASVTCTLSGSYGAQPDGIAAGTYSLVTTYSGAAPTGRSKAGEPLSAGTDPNLLNYFGYTSFAPNTDMVLTLSTLASPIDLVTNGEFANSTFSFLFTGTPVCSGAVAPSCTAYAVGTTTGAVFSAPSTISLDITAPATTPVPLPGTLGMALSGLLVVGAVAISRRRLFGEGSLAHAAI